MSELDSSTPVIWPKWCYAGVDGGKASVTVSPSAVAGGASRVSNSSSAGSCPGSPATAAVSSPASSLPRSPPRPVLHAPRPTTCSYSDIMRALAAKYNDADNKSYTLPALPSAFTSSRIPSRFGRIVNDSFSVSAIPKVEKDYSTSPQSLSPRSDLTTSASDVSVGVFPSFSSLPVLDMLAMYGRTTAVAAAAITASPAVKSQKEAKSSHRSKTANNDEGGRKRSISVEASPCHPAVSSPLDLSNIKRPRLRQNSNDGAANLRKDVSSESLPESDCADDASPQRDATTCVYSSSSPEAQRISQWTPQDVANFVRTIDGCSEYAELFEEHRINGALLPMLKAEHLANILGMKLGPSLQVVAAVATTLNICSVCSHCRHCHATSVSPGVSAAVTAPSTAMSPANPLSPGT